MSIKPNVRYRMYPEDYDVNTDEPIDNQYVDDHKLGVDDTTFFETREEYLLWIKTHSPGVEDVLSPLEAEYEDIIEWEYVGNVGEEATDIMWPESPEESQTRVS